MGFLSTHLDFDYAGLILEKATARFTAQIKKLRDLIKPPVFVMRGIVDRHIQPPIPASLQACPVR